MTIIDKETWPRRAHYDFFTPMSDPFYTLTLSLIHISEPTRH